MRVLGALCVFGALFLGAAQPAFAKACTFGQAGYDSISSPGLALSVEESGGISVRRMKAPRQTYRFEVVNQSGVNYLYRTDKGRNDSPTHFAFFDENLVATKPPNSASSAPGYIFITAYPDFGETMFELKRCKIEGSTVSVSLRDRPTVSVPACPFIRAAYTNIEDPSLTIRSEKDRAFFASLKVIIEGDKTPERPYMFGFTNGIGTTFIQTADDGKDGTSEYMFLDESLRVAGISSADDPAPAYFFMTDMASVPASMFRLKECKPETPAAKPAQ